MPVLSIGIGKIMGTFLEEVNAGIDGVPIQRCYHCRKCTAGCPLAFAMEYSLDKVVRMIQMERRREVLKSDTIWLCVSCETCITRCPNEVDIARMMDVLREMAVDDGIKAKEKNILKLHESFLSCIKTRGRINEPLLVAGYKLKSGDLFSDLAMGRDMYSKGKLSLLSPKTKDMQAVRRIFEKTKNRRPEEEKR